MITLNDELGWVVTCHYPDVLTYVSPGDLPSDPSEMEIGLLGWGRRDADARELKIIHDEESTSDA